MDPEELFLLLLLLEPAHALSAGTDRYVSFERTPDLADDTDATIDQALERYDQVTDGTCAG